MERDTVSTGNHLPVQTTLAVTTILLGAGIAQ
jgi:hypothetical protein